MAGEASAIQPKSSSADVFSAFRRTTTTTASTWALSAIAWPAQDRRGVDEHHVGATPCALDDAANGSVEAEFVTVVEGGAGRKHFETAGLPHPPRVVGSGEVLGQADRLERLDEPLVEVKGPVEVRMTQSCVDEYSRRPARARATARFATVVDSLRIDGARNHDRSRTVLALARSRFHRRRGTARRRGSCGRRA
jgi:hypothetical protein